MYQYLYLVQEIRKKMKESIIIFNKNIDNLSIIPSRILDSIKVNINNNTISIKKLISVNTINSKIIIIKVWNHQFIIKIKNAIINSNLNLNPIIEENLIKIPIPLFSQ